MCANLFQVSWRGHLITNLNLSGLGGGARSRSQLVIGCGSINRPTGRGSKPGREPRCATCANLFLFTPCFYTLDKKYGLNIFFLLVKDSIVTMGPESRYAIKFPRNFREIWAQRNERNERNLGALRAKLWSRASCAPARV